MVRASRCRTHPRTKRCIRSRPRNDQGSAFRWLGLRCCLSLATGACHDLAIAPYKGKGTGETNLFRRMYDTLKPGDVVLADALFDDYFIACELCQREIDIVARAQYVRTGSWAAESRPDGDILVWQRPNKPRGMTGEQYRRYPKQLLMREVTVDARDKNNRVQAIQSRYHDSRRRRSMAARSVVCMSGGGMEKSISDRSRSRCRWTSCVARRPDMVHKEIWTHLLAYNLLRTVMAVAADENDIEPRQVSFKGAKQTLTAFAPKIEAAQPEDRGPLIDAMLTTIAYHRVGDRPGRWEPRARKRRPRKAARLTQPRHIAKLPHNRSKWF